MEKITQWYADKIGKTSDEFDAIDKHIETVIQTWEKERIEALTIPVVVGQSEQLFCRDCKYDKAESEHDKMWCRDCQQKDRFKAK